ncbi:ATP-dependent DNA helicase RecG [Patescibacteria group bacterium]|nr:ATP-dependent DNA helicase RecG [Patescibacteria group bacterium]MBU1868117.1 ATP-dependent DNA helicase RecG [Patescibacteria group bacterium]
MITLKDPVTKVPLIGPVQAKKLEKLKINTVKDLLYHFPHRYDDFTQIKPLASIRVGEKTTIKAPVTALTQHFTRTRKSYIMATLADDSGSIQAVWWNQPWIKQTLRVGQNYYFSGKVAFFSRKLTLTSPDYELENTETIHTSGIVPIYPEGEGISSKWLRSRTNAVLKILGYKELNETSNQETELDNYPLEFRKKYNLLYLPLALSWIHFPNNFGEVSRARERLAFDELFGLQLKNQHRRQSWENRRATYSLNLEKNKTAIQKFITSLPFTLTNAQKNVTQRISEDLKRNIPMNRLLQGDVGSGKTVVAAAAVYATYLSGYKSLLMAPTEILARQHLRTLSELFKVSAKLKIALLTGSTKPTSHNLQESNLVIGTHALFHSPAELKKVGLIVIDEQHRFGVKQRGKLVDKGIETNKALTPHILSLTATPIPRSIALTVYGDQDLSVINEMPPGRKPVITWLVPGKKRPGALMWVKEQIKRKNHQAFIVCPFIEESEHETLQTVKAAKAEFSRLQKDVFPDLILGLVHGKLKAKEKNEVLVKFRNGELHILVATPVVEVGIDIPKANLMIIEGAERFGLASLHQLRGRIGRSGEQAYCLLFTSTHNPEQNQRLNAMRKYHNGLKLAEIDLEIRGPGELFGTRQHGFWDLKIASLSDLRLIEKTKNAAREYGKIRNI